MNRKKIKKLAKQIEKLLPFQVLVLCIICNLVCSFNLYLFFVTPIICGVYGYVKTRNATITSIIYFIITFIYMLWFLTYYTPFGNLNKNLVLSALFLSTILTGGCLLAGAITHIVIGYEERKKKSTRKWTIMKTEIIIQWSLWFTAIAYQIGSNEFERVCRIL